jgi:hypothetical protein
MKRTTRIALAVVVGIMTAAFPRLAEAACEGSPNVVLLVADDLGWEDLPFFASPIHWPTDESENPDQPNDPDQAANHLAAIKKIRGDWNLLAARMMADQGADDCTSQPLNRATPSFGASWPPAGVAVPTGTPGSNENFPRVTPNPFMVLPRDWEGSSHTYSCAPSGPAEGAIRGFGGLKRVAAQGAVVSRFYTTAAVCGPSRYSFMTGRQGRRHGFGDPNAHIAGKNEQTIADLLKTEGYRTAIFGKWHLGPAVGGKDYLNCDDCQPNDGRLCCDDGSPWQSGFEYGAVYAGILLGHTVYANSTLACGPRHLDEDEEEYEYLGPHPTPGASPDGYCQSSSGHVSGIYSVPADLSDDDCGRSADEPSCTNSTRFLTDPPFGSSRR